MPVFGSDVQRWLAMSVPTIQYVIVWVNIVHVLFRIIIYHLLNFGYTIYSSTIKMILKKGYIEMYLKNFSERIFSSKSFIIKERPCVV